MKREEEEEEKEAERIIRGGMRVVGKSFGVGIILKRESDVPLLSLGNI